METKHPAQGTVDAQTAVANAMTEDELLANVKDLATKLGYRVYHTHDSRRSDEGFPDLVLARLPSTLHFAELKTMKGRLTAAQLTWMSDLQLVTYEPAGAVGNRLTFLWRPCCWVSGEIERVLR